MPAGHHSMPQTLPIRHGFRRWPPWGSNTGLQPRTSSSTSAQQDHRRGEVPERSNGAVSKTVDPLRGPRVRIPVSPPFQLSKILILLETSNSLPPILPPWRAGCPRIVRNVKVRCLPERHRAPSFTAAEKSEFADKCARTRARAYCSADRRAVPHRGIHGPQVLSRGKDLRVTKPSNSIARGIDHAAVPT